MKKRKGAASFYIVAFSTLILVIVAVSFATVILSEMSRSMNDDLSQSAYDSALAGVEDAKVAFANYQRCLEANFGSTDCQRIKNIMANPSCDMVAKMLYGTSGEVTVGGVSTGSSTTTNQAYTCVKILTQLSDYRSSLGTKTGNYVQTVKLGVADGGTNTVNKIRFSWYSVKKTNSYTAWNSVASGKGVFRPVSSLSLPPTIEMQIIQTGINFSLSDFDIVQSGRTNRATLYLTPSNSSGSNTISAAQVVKTNDHNILNQPFVVRCGSSGEFYCSVDVELPGVINGGNRANETFLVSVSLPYREPDTDFAIELICSNGTGCGGTKAVTAAGVSNTMVNIKNTQVAIESTGRANDLYRRVETRLESSDTSFGMGKESPFYGLMVLGIGGVNKNMTVRYENKSGPFYF